MQVRAVAERERQFHNQRFAGAHDERDKVAKFYSVNIIQDALFNDRVLDGIRGSDLLELGCGKGETAFYWHAHGARVTGIDIADGAIAQARSEAQRTGNNVRFMQVDCERMTEFASESFDIVTGRGILHHLDLSSSLAEIARVLRPNGRAIFVEPLGHNPLINAYRRLTPALRTVDEHPLLMPDLDLARTWFRDVTVHYFHLTTLLAVPLRSLAVFPNAVGLLHRLDRWLMERIPTTKKYAWTVVLELNDPLR